MHLSFKRIEQYIAENSTKRTKSKFTPKSQSVLEFGVLITNKANESLGNLKLDISELSGNPKIVLQDGREELRLPEHIKREETFSNQERMLEEYIGLLLGMEEFVFKLEKYMSRLLA